MIDPTLALFPIATQDSRHLFVTDRKGLQTLADDIEDAVLVGNVRTRLFVGFQKLSFFLRRAAKYRDLSRVCDGIWVFALPDVEPPSIPGLTYVPLTEAHRLTREWALVVDCPAYFSALVAEDLSGFGVPNDRRQFQGVWSFDATMVNRLQRALSEALGLPPLEAVSTARRDPQRELDHVARAIRRLVETLERQNRRLKQVQQFRTDLTNMLVHDLRSPLTAIIGYLGLIESQGARGTPERLARYAKAAGESARTLTEMVSALLDIAKLQEGKLILRRTAVAPRALLQAAADLARPVAEQQQKALTVEGVETLPPVWGDAELLTRVLNNLVTNALKYTSPGGHIALSAIETGGEVEFAVSDDGPGIPAEALGRLFGKFEQVGAPPQGHGSGLGLYFCRMMVEAHGGSIRVESEPGKGSTFRFTIPCTRR